MGGDRRHAWRLRVQAWSAAIACLAPAVVLAVAHRLWIRRRALVGLGEKLAGRGPRLPRGGVVVHGVSLGEVALMRAVIPAIRRAGLVPVLTTSTETGAAGLEKSFPQEARAFWPFDLPWAVGGFLARSRPRAVILLEAEFWPLALAACHARGIPVLVVNGRASPRSTDRLAALPSLTRGLFSGVALVVAQTPIYGARFRRLGARRVAVTGSLKADLVRPAAAAPWWEAHGIGSDRPLLLLASTSDGEEANVLGRGLAPWAGWRIAIVPRHPERGAVIADLVERLGGIPRRTSQGGQVAGDADILIADEIGRLGEGYRRCAESGGIAVVGGGLGSGRGGQNMLEAAAAGCCTVVGWDCKAQPDPMAILRAADAVVELVPGQVAPVLAALAADRVRRSDLGRRAQVAWSAGRGAIVRLDRHLGAAFARCGLAPGDPP